MAITNFSSPDDLPELVTKARKEVVLDETSDVTELAREFVKEILSNGENGAALSTLCGMKIDKVRYEVATVLAGPKLAPQDIRTVMEYHFGKSLPELNFIGKMDYSVQFFHWFKETHAAHFKTWMEHEQIFLKDTYPEFDPDATLEGNMLLGVAHDLLIEFSKDRLNNNLTESEHDTILAEFCNAFPNARRHINLLLSDIREQL